MIVKESILKDWSVFAAHPHIFEETERREMRMLKALSSTKAPIPNYYWDARKGAFSVLFLSDGANRQLCTRRYLTKIA